MQYRAIWTRVKDPTFGAAYWIQYADSERIVGPGAGSGRFFLPALILRANTAAEWLDTNYGAFLRQLFANGIGGTALHVLAPEARPFGDARGRKSLTADERQRFLEAAAQAANELNVDLDATSPTLFARRSRRPSAPRRKIFWCGCETSRRDP